MLLARVVLLLAVLGGLGLAQIHLKFRTRDLQIETRKLQQARADLENRKIALVSRVERLKRCDEAFRDYARSELGLRECPPDRISKAFVSAEALARWRHLARAVQRPSAPVDQPPVRVLAELGQRMMSLSTPLMARDTDEERK